MKKPVPSVSPACPSSVALAKEDPTVALDTFDPANCYDVKNAEDMHWLMIMWSHDTHRAWGELMTTMWHQQPTPSLN